LIDSLKRGAIAKAGASVKGKVLKFIR